ncbi:hypothetical protein DERF_014622 [Dermatophagoides farinae]|uniref:Uncharacterized protein n=1 Tax=Dermatophagoides farinae TaxID=6954 RepID=A0A922HPI2_DERFA|nr:hypothetical protein DERF_014622 [Dermatophagoides farinae]
MTNYCDLLQFVEYPDIHLYDPVDGLEISMLVVDREQQLVQKQQQNSDVLPLSKIKRKWNDKMVAYLETVRSGRIIHSSSAAFSVHYMIETNNVTASILSFFSGIGRLGAGAATAAFGRGNLVPPIAFTGAGTGAGAAGRS